MDYKIFTFFGESFLWKWILSLPRVQKMPIKLSKWGIYCKLRTDTNIDTISTLLQPPYELITKEARPTINVDSEPQLRLKQLREHFIELKIPWAESRTRVFTNVVKQSLLTSRSKLEAIFIGLPKYFSSGDLFTF